MRLLLLALLASLGFVADASASRPSRWRVASAGERARQGDVATAFAERAPPADVPVRVGAHAGRSVSPSRVGGGGVDLLGEWDVAAHGRRSIACAAAAAPPRPGAPTRRRQPEGRGPPRGPRAA